METTLPMSLLDLQVAIDAGKDEDIRAFYQACDVLSGNDQLLEMGQRHGFETFLVEADPFPKRVMLARDLVKIMYTTTSTTPVRLLLARHNFEFTAIGAFDHGNQKLLRHVFRLDPSDGRTTFATWEHYLLVAMYGQTEQARKVRAYIMQAEAAARVYRKVEASTGKSPSEVEAEAKIRKHGDLSSVLDSIERDRLLLLNQAEIREELAVVKDTTAQVVQRQDDLADENARLRTEIEATVAKADYAVEQATGLMTIEEFVVGNKLMAQLPEQYWRTIYPGWLTAYCLLHKLAIQPKPVIGKSWTHEQSYPIAALMAMLRDVQRRPVQFYLFRTP
jgi:hypothetical protein